MFSLITRLGCGLDIESSDGVCYIVEDEDEDGNVEAYVTGFVGLTISVPFFKFMWGTFHELDTTLLSN
tara:strand:- start:655 stop:858 length:204 start_codon:yes stop_codon:yes gene_type:complete